MTEAQAKKITEIIDGLISRGFVFTETNLCLKRGDETAWISTTPSGTVRLIRTAMRVVPIVDETYAVTH